MDILYYKEIEITFREVMDNLDNKLRYNLKFENLEGFEIICNELFKEFYTLIEPYKDKINKLESFEKFKGLIKNV